MFLWKFVSAIVVFLPLTNTILDDDILYDIKWLPDLTIV